MSTPMSVRQTIRSRVDRLADDECREIVRLVADCFSDTGPSRTGPPNLYDLASDMCDAMGAIQDTLRSYDLMPDA